MIELKPMSDIDLINYVLEKITNNIEVTCNEISFYIRGDDVRGAEKQENISDIVITNLSNETTYTLVQNN